MAFNPIFPSPLSDFEYIIQPNFRVTPHAKFCTKIQLKYGDCMEAYGMPKGYTHCAELLYDLLECSHHYIQRKRYVEIQNERMKQYRAGKIAKPFEENPPLDAYF